MGDRDIMRGSSRGAAGIEDRDRGSGGMQPPLVAGATTFPPLKRGHYGYCALSHMTLWESIERPILPPE